eukprot:2476934-Rhodomonas_salina.1
MSRSRRWVPALTWGPFGVFGERVQGPRHPKRAVIVPEQVVQRRYCRTIVSTSLGTTVQKKSVPASVLPYNTQYC